MIEREYRTTSSSIWFTLIVFPLVLLCLLFGVTCFIVAGLNPLSIVFTGLGLLTAYSVLNHSWSRTTFSPEGIYKSNLLSPKRFVPWSTIEYWQHVEDSEIEIERIEFLLKSGKRLAIYSNEAESHGLDELLLDLQLVIGDLEN